MAALGESAAGSGFGRLASLYGGEFNVSDVPIETPERGIGSRLCSAGHASSGCWLEQTWLGSRSAAWLGLSSRRKRQGGKGEQPARPQPYEFEPGKPLSNPPRWVKGEGQEEDEDEEGRWLL